MKTKSTFFIVLILLSSRLLSQTAQVSDATEFSSALADGNIDRIELQNDITVPSSVYIERDLTISGGALDMFTLAITDGEVTIRNNSIDIVVTLEDLVLSMHNPDVLRPYGIKHMRGELIANNLTIDLKCGDGGFQPGLAPSGIYVHMGTTSTIDGCLIEVDNDYTGATYGVYFTTGGDHTVTNTAFNLVSMGTYRLAFGTQNVTGPPGGPFALANFPTLNLTGNSSTGATHCMMVYLENGDDITQMNQAKDIIYDVIVNNRGAAKSNALPQIGQIRYEGEDDNTIITDYPRTPIPIPLAGWVVFLTMGLVLVFGLIRTRIIH